MLFNFLSVEQIGMIAVGLFFIWLFSLSVFLFKTVRHYNLLTKKTKKKDLMKILEKISFDIEGNQKKIKELFEKNLKLEKDALKHIQQVGLLRYNPFSDTGGDQSFVLSMLDGQDNGMILSSLHGRSSTRVYAKTVKKGKGEPFVLSKEEEEAIKRSKKGRKK